MTKTTISSVLVGREGFNQTDGNKVLAKTQLFLAFGWSKKLLTHLLDGQGICFALRYSRHPWLVRVSPVINVLKRIIRIFHL